MKQNVVGYKSKEASCMIKTYNFREDNLLLGTCNNFKEIKDTVDEIVYNNKELLPKSKDSHILLKPNLNNDLNALTGNSTDLRIIAAIVKSLKDHGYCNITIADGPNVGIDRRNIDVFKRLRIDKFARFYNVNILNLNRCDAIKVKLATDYANIASVCLKADFIINIPKIKTHAEAIMSSVMKNLVGCVIGQEKRKMHNDLARNIICLNEVIKPGLHIVDGIIAMEGNGPGDGKPRKLGIIIAGHNPFLVDLAITKLVGLDWQKIGYLNLARNKGYFTEKDIMQIGKNISSIVNIEKAPEKNFIAKISELKELYWLKKLMRSITSQKSILELAYKLKIIQDLYSLEEDEIEAVNRDGEKCLSCGECNIYCPTGIETQKIGQMPADNRCINCLYCFFVCPNDALKITGKQGFMKRHIEKYKAVV